MRLIGTALLAYPLLFSGAVRAECATPYTTEAMAQDLGAMTTSLRSLDETRFTTAGARLSDGLVCLNTTLPASAYASAYRYVGTYHFLSGREEQARAWYRTALEIDPSFEWDINDLPIDNPIRRVFDEERSGAVVDPARIEGQLLLPPEGGYLLLDGRKMRRAEAATSRPHLLQVVSGGDVTAAHLIEGNAIPAEYLVAGEEKETQKVAQGRQVDVIQRMRPPLKTPLLIVGGVGVTAGIGLYVGSIVTHGKFKKATTTSEVLKLQGTTNSLVIASGACLLVGLGSGYAGIILDGVPGFWYTTRF